VILKALPVVPKATALGPRPWPPPAGPKAARASLLPVGLGQFVARLDVVAGEALSESGGFVGPAVGVVGVDLILRGDSAGIIEAGIGNAAGLGVLDHGGVGDGDLLLRDVGNDGLYAFVKKEADENDRDVKDDRRAQGQKRVNGRLLEKAEVGERRGGEARGFGAMGVDRRARARR